MKYIIYLTLSIALSWPFMVTSNEEKEEAQDIPYTHVSSTPDDDYLSQDYLNELSAIRKIGKFQFIQYGLVWLVAVAANGFIIWISLDAGNAHQTLVGSAASTNVTMLNPPANVTGNSTCHTFFVPGNSSENGNWYQSCNGPKNKVGQMYWFAGGIAGLAVSALSCCINFITCRLTK